MVEADVLLAVLLAQHTELVHTPMDPASLAVCMESLAACLSELWVDSRIGRSSQLQQQSLNALHDAMGRDWTAKFRAQLQ
jgi:hypothetical protein